MMSKAPFYSSATSTYATTVMFDNFVGQVVRMTPDLEGAVEAALAVANMLGIGGRTGARSVDITLDGTLTLSVRVIKGGLLC